MASRLMALLLFPVLLASAAAKKVVATASGENDDLILTVTLYIDRTDVKEMVGSDLDGHYFFADVKVEPKYGKEITINRDDFLLRSLNDNDSSKPFSPNQIAGASVMVLSRSRGGAPPVEPTQGAQVPMGYPPYGYPGGASIGGGSSGGDYSNNKATVKDGGDAKPTPLEKTLEAKILPEKKTTEPVKGLLYFAMEKQKMNDLVLVYGGKENRITLRFNK
jgi:hypothetical protein